MEISWCKVKDRTALRWMCDLFQGNIMTMLWAVGDALADFGNKRMFVIYGPGGLGKSAIVKIIKEARL